jgi:hypothetical protein
MSRQLGQDVVMCFGMPVLCTRIWLPVERKVYSSGPFLIATSNFMEFCFILYYICACICFCTFVAALF